jgi:hypothetical protein
MPRDPQMGWNPVRAFITIVVVMALLMLWITCNLHHE